MPTPTLPAEEELKSAWNALADAEERFSEIESRVLRFIAGDEELQADYADIGRLLAWSHECRTLVLRRISEELTRVDRAIFHDLVAIVRDGGQRSSIPLYDELGRENYAPRTEER
jgi:hypothetical protein